MYANERGVEQDYILAVKWFLKAAEQNYAKSRVSLGVRYSHEQGVEIDKRKALYWYPKGAELGRSMAQHHLADLYLNDYIKNKNEILERLEQARRNAEAVKWFKKAGSNRIAKGYTMAKNSAQAPRCSVLAMKSGDLNAGKVIMALTLGVVLK